MASANPKSDTQSGDYIDFSTIEESVVSTMGHDASIPNRGIMINAIVKSGGNDFHGGLYTSWTNHRFQSSNVDGALAAQGIMEGNDLAVRDDYNAEIGGRITRDKLWFWVSGRSQREKEKEIGCFIPESGEPCHPVAARVLRDPQRDMADQPLEQDHRHDDVQHPARRRGREPAGRVGTAYPSTWIQPDLERRMADGARDVRRDVVYVWRVDEPLGPL